MAEAFDFAVAIARMAADNKCSNVKVLDVTGLSPVTDYMVVATGSSARQMKSSANEIEELGDERGYGPLARTGLEGETWMLVDFVDVVFHVFSVEARLYYDLDNLWGDARFIDWQTGR